MSILEKLKEETTPKDDKRLLWISVAIFVALQGSFVALLYFWGPKLVILASILAFISLIALTIIFSEILSGKIKDKWFRRLRKWTMVICIAADVAVGMLIYPLFSGILIVESKYDYTMKWVKSDYYVTDQSDTIFLKKGDLYVDNQTDLALYYYFVSYGRPVLPFGNNNVTVIPPHSVEKIGRRKPDYILENPPHRIRTKEKFETRAVLNFK